MDFGVVVALKYAEQSAEPLTNGKEETLIALRQASALHALVTAADVKCTPQPR